MIQKIKYSAQKGDDAEVLHHPSAMCDIYYRLLILHN